MTKQSASPAALKYRVVYDWRKGSQSGQSGWTALATGAVQPLNWFHEAVQLKAERNYSRQIVRPKLTHDEYKMVLFVRDGFSPYDLPVTPNPDLAPKKREPRQPVDGFEFAASANGMGRMAT